jgi:hypothetical protein
MALRPQDKAKWGGDVFVSNIKFHLIFIILQFTCESKSLFIHFSKWIMWVEGPLMFQKSGHIIINP